MSTFDFKKLKMYLLSNYPFYYSLINQCKINFDSESKYVAYVAVQTKIELTINPVKIQVLPVPEQAGILVHELLHIYKDHIKQSLNKQVDAISSALGIETNHIMANIATDLEINQLIGELKYSQVIGPKCKNDLRPVYTKDFKLKDGDTWPNYYALLKKSAKEDKQPHQDHEYFEKSTKNEEMFNEVVVNATKRAKATHLGSTPKECESFLLNYEASKQLPWNLILRQFMTSLVGIKTNNTWKKVNRRFKGKLPGVKKLPELDLLVGIDSSGSMSDEDLQKVYSEIEAINNTGLVKIDMCVFDTEVHQREPYVKGFEAKRICSGGTSFVGVHEIAVAERYKGVVYLTDGYAEFPDKNEVNYKCLWVLNNEHVKPPYGSVARIK